MDIASLHPSDVLSSRRTIWAVRLGDTIHVRSVHGSGSGSGSDWYRGTRARQEGRIEAGGLAKDVAFLDVADEADADEINDAVDAAYIIQAITSEEANSTTMQLVPR
ncbi:DUF2255 family protein [Streptomyces sp. CA-249302]|uniref:DUF2255 family protein n=1 Tax=Streptomyces sp. CA-249302 TaxID=3240058 RepID=UPI003D9455D0